MSKPASATQIPEPKAILDYVPELLEEMDRVKAEEDAARDELKRIDSKITETEILLYARRSELARPDRSSVLAAAALRGEKPPPVPVDPPGPDPKELEATIKGLQAMRAEPKERIANARTELRARVMRALREAAERAAVDYLQHARALEALHTDLGTVQAIMDSVGFDVKTTILGADWWALCIPSSDQLAALQGPSRMAYFHKVLAGGDKGESAQRASQAGFEKCRAEITRRFGYWPLAKER